MLDFLQKNKNIFATQPIILKPSGKIENIGFYVDLKIGKAYPITDKSLWDKNWDKKRYLLGLSATCLLVRGELLKRVGFFDESFHSYLEDVDLAVRCFKNNLPLFPNFQASATHLHMATSSQMGSYKAKRDFINWIRIIKKNYSMRMIIKYLPFLLAERLKNLFGIIKGYYLGRCKPTWFKK
jgi:GT2 family glycosyltransferase